MRAMVGNLLTTEYIQPCMGNEMLLGVVLPTFPHIMLDLLDLLDLVGV